MATQEQAGVAATSEGIDVRQYVHLLWSYKWIVLGIVVLVGGGVLLWTLKQPRVYQATTTIEYDPNPASPLGREVEDVANPSGSFWMSREFFATQNRIIESRAISERVVAELGLNHDPSFFYLDSFNDTERPSGLMGVLRGLAGTESSSARDDSHPTVEQAARVLQNRLSVEAVDDTRIVAISVTDRDPERAASLANAIADAYIAKTLEDRMGSTVSALEWLGNRLDTLRTSLDESELALHRFKEEHNVLSVSMEDRQNLVANDIQFFNEALTKVRTQRIELQARAERIRGIAEAETPEESAAAFPENETISALREQLREKLAEQQGLGTRYGPNHQRMQQIQREVENLREQLGAEIAGVLRAAEANVREVHRIESGVRSALEDAHSAGLELNLREIEYRRLNRERENNSKLYDLVLERSTETNLTRMIHTTHARILDRALPGGRISPNMTTNVGGGVMAGALLGLAVAFLLSRLDRRLKSVAEVENVGLSILGILPRIDAGLPSQPDPESRAKKRRKRANPANGQPTTRDLFVHTHPMSAAAECCRTIRTNLTFMSADNPIRSMVITSASPREGKTTVTANIAISIAQSGHRVLMIDTDLRRPRIHRAFGVSGARGVTSIIVGEDSLVDLAIETSIPNLDVLPCGPIPPNPSELLHSSGFRALVDEALRTYDRVIFDSPPLGAVTDAAVLAPQLDAVLVVVKAQSTTREALHSALKQLTDVGANIVGGVLNDLDPRQKGYGSGDYYYYYRREGYYAAQSDDHGDGDVEASTPTPPPA